MGLEPGNGVTALHYGVTALHYRSHKLLAPFGMSQIAPRQTPSFGVPNGIRTRVAALKERSPRPLDDGDTKAG